VPLQGRIGAPRESLTRIDPEHPERISEVFCPTKSSGVGTGLSICRSLVDACGGLLWAEPNETFVFSSLCVPGQTNSWIHVRPLTRTQSGMNTPRENLLIDRLVRVTDDAIRQSASPVIVMG
jgi:hypothetical protein